MPERILVAGLGNELLADDGLGVHAIRALAVHPCARRDNVRLLEIGTAVLDALDALEWADHVVVLDAVRAGGAPGTCYRVTGGLRAPDRSEGLHALSLVGALTLLAPGHVAPSMTLIGMEPDRIDYGMSLSPVVEAGLPAMLNHVVEHLAELGPAQAPGQVEGALQ